jgi:hypothetical protein
MVVLARHISGKKKRARTAMRAANDVIVLGRKDSRMALSSVSESFSDGSAPVAGQR